MVSVRAAKQKGSSFEYDVQYSLTAIYPDIYRTAERGFQLQYDLHCEASQRVIECKRLKGISWNQLARFFKKLDEVTDPKYKKYICFQSNRQPCLVFERIQKSPVQIFRIKKFEYVFNTPFEKHPSTRVRKK